MDKPGGKRLLIKIKKCTNILAYTFDIVTSAFIVVLVVLGIPVIFPTLGIAFVLLSQTTIVSLLILGWKNTK